MSSQQDSQTPDSASANPTLTRLDEQFKWHDKKSGVNQKCYKRLKIVSIVVAASVPVLALSGERLVWITALAGVILVILEGLQQLYQYNANWLSYRSTAEALTQEKHLYLAGAGPYLEAENPLVRLAERVEAILSKQNSGWLHDQVKAAEKVKSPGQPSQ